MKCLLYSNRLHYDVIKTMYGENAHILFTDNESLMQTSRSGMSTRIWS